MKISVYSIVEIILLLLLIIIINWRDLLCEDVELSLVDTVMIWLSFMDEPTRCPKKEHVIFQAVAEFLLGVGTFVFPSVLVIMLCGFVKVVAASLRCTARLISMVSVLLFVKPCNIAKFYASRIYCVLEYAKDWTMCNYCSAVRANKKECKAKSFQSKAKAGHNYRYNFRHTTTMRNNKAVVVFFVDRIGEDRVDVFEKCEEQGRFRCIMSYDRKYRQ